MKFAHKQLSPQLPPDGVTTCVSLAHNDSDLVFALADGRVGSVCVSGGGGDNVHKLRLNEDKEEMNRESKMGSVAAFGFFSCVGDILVAGSRASSRGKAHALSASRLSSTPSSLSFSLSASILKSQQSAAETFAVAPSALHAICCGRPAAAAGSVAPSEFALVCGDAVGLFDVVAGSSSSQRATVESRAPLRSPAQLTCGAYSSLGSSGTSVMCFGSSMKLEPLVFDARTGGFPSAAALLAASNSAALASASSSGVVSIPSLLRGTKTGAVAISAHPLDANVVATAQHDGLVALFDLRQPQQVLAVSHAADAGSEVVDIFWNHSPADVLSLVSTSGVEAIQFSSCGCHTESLLSRLASGGSCVFPITAAVQKTWTPRPEIVAVDSAGQLHSFSLSDSQLDRLAPVEMPPQPSSNRGASSSMLQQLGGNQQQNDLIFAPVDDIFSIAPASSSSSNSSSKKNKSNGQNISAEVDETKFRQALRLSYRRRVNESKTLTLGMLSSVLNYREKHNQHSSGNGKSHHGSASRSASASATVSAAQERKVEDIIALSIAAKRDDAGTVWGGSSASSSSAAGPSLLSRNAALHSVSSRLVEAALLPPRRFTELLQRQSSAGAAGTHSLLPAAAEKFVKAHFSHSSSTESRLAAMSVHLAISEAVHRRDARAVAAHRQILARVITDGSVSPHLTAKVFHLLLSSAESISDASWIVENSLLLPSSSSGGGGGGVPVAATTSGRIKDDAVEEEDGDESATGKRSKLQGKGRRRKERGSNNEDKEGSDEEEEEEEEEEESSSDDDDSPFTKTTAAASPSKAATALENSHAMLANINDASSAAAQQQRKHVYAILEALLYPLACDADADDAGVGEFFETGSAVGARSSLATTMSSPASGGGGGGGGATSSSKATNDGSATAAGAAATTASSSTATIRKRDRRSARDAKKLIKVFLRDCGSGAAAGDPQLFDRVVRAVLSLRKTELQMWKPPAAMMTISGTGAGVSGAVAAEQCVRFFADFEQLSRGRGVAAAACSRYMVVRYAHSLRVCRPAAALWMCAELSDVLSSKAASRPLGSWLMDFAMKLVDELCDCADIVIDDAEKLIEIAAQPVVRHHHSHNQQQHHQNINLAKEKDVMKLASEMHAQLSRIVSALYEGEAVFSKINSKSSESEAVMFMGESIDRIGEAMIDALGAWNQLLQDSKSKTHMKTVAGGVSVCELIRSSVSSFGSSISKLAAVGEVDETFTTLMSALDDFLETEQQEE